MITYASTWFLSYIFYSCICSCADLTRWFLISLNKSKNDAEKVGEWKRYFFHFALTQMNRGWSQSAKWRIITLAFVFSSIYWFAYCARNWTEKWKKDKFCAAGCSHGWIIWAHPFIFPFAYHPLSLLTFLSLWLNGNLAVSPFHFFPD